MEQTEQTNLDIYGHAALPWERAVAALGQAAPMTTYWLATTCPDGRPHSTGVGVCWLDGRFYFTSGPGTLKSRNLARAPQCSISVSLAGLDLVVEGAAAKVADAERVARVARAYAANGWPASEVDGRITAPFSAPSAGPGPWDLYELTAQVAFGTASAEPYGATRWRFSGAA